MREGERFGTLERDHTVLVLRALYKARNIIVTNIKLSKICLVINWHTKILSSLVGESDADAFAFSFCVTVNFYFLPSTI